MNTFLNITKLILVISLTIFALNSSAVAAVVQPYQYNVFANGQIGTASTPYGNGVEGITGSLGNSYFTSFSAQASHPYSPYSIYSGGSVTINGGSSANGGIEAANTVNLSSVSIQGNIVSGGNLQGGFGQVLGNAYLTGNNTSNLTITGSVQSNVPYTPSQNLQYVKQYFQSASSFWGALAPTATVTNYFGQLQISNLLSGRNVVNLTLSEINNAWGYLVNGPSNAFLVINILDATPTQTLLKSLSSSLNGGIASSNILFNLPNATNLSLSGSYSSILTPNSTVNFTSGSLAGNLIVNNLQGSTYITQGQFSGFAADQNNFMPTPEPSTYLILGSILLAIPLLKRRHRFPDNKQTFIQ